MFSLFTRAKEVYRGQGLNRLIRLGISFVYNYAYWMLFVRLRPSPGTFTFQGRAYKYYYHWYNTTWRNERAVEVPVILEEVKLLREGRVLEVGNVLSHYVHFQHDIVDKDDKTIGVINQDVVDFQPDKKYDLIVSISTLEHVGYDEQPKEPEKSLIAINNLVEHALSPGGRMVVTFPLGYNTAMDRLLTEGKLRFTERFYLKRVSHRNDWVEVGWDEAKGAKYDAPFPSGNVIVCAIVELIPEFVSVPPA